MILKTRSYWKDSDNQCISSFSYSLCPTYNIHNNPFDSLIWSNYKTLSLFSLWKVTAIIATYVSYFSSTTLLITDVSVWSYSVPFRNDFVLQLSQDYSCNLSTGKASYRIILVQGNHNIWVRIYSFNTYKIKAFCFHLSFRSLGVLIGHIKTYEAFINFLLLLLMFSFVLASVKHHESISNLWFFSWN